MTFYPDLAVPGAAALVGSFASRAAESRVRRLVLLSGRGEEEAQRAEARVQASGVPWTIVRSSWFAQNFSETFLQVVGHGGGDRAVTSSMLEVTSHE